jgi:hypothetical protein
MHRAEQVDRNLSRREVDRLARAAGFGPARDAGIRNDQLDLMCPIERASQVASRSLSVTSIVAVSTVAPAARQSSATAEIRAASRASRPSATPGAA